MELKWVGRQYIRIGVNMLTEFDLIPLVIYVCVVSFIWYNSNKPLTPSYVVYVLSYYVILCKKISNLLGFSVKYSGNAYVSLRRIQVKKNIEEEGKCI